MEFYRNFPCDCKNFVNILLKYLTDVVSDSDLNDQHLQLQKLEVFLKQYICRISTVNSYHAEPCSPMHFTKVLEKLKKKEKWTSINLFTDIFNVMCLIYLDGITRLILKWSMGNGSVLSDAGKETARIVTALEGKSKYMKLLVNMDLLPILDSKAVIEERIMTILCEFTGIADFDGFIRIPSKIKKATYIFYCGNHDIRLRIYLSLLAIKAVLLKLKSEEDIAKEYIYCLRMYFITTRDPFLTINEVRTMLYLCFSVLKKLHLFESVYDEFVKIMPECSAKFEPRNLTDLARCQMRDNIRKCNVLLPAAVAKLNLAQPLKDFVLGDVIHMSRKNGNNTEQVIAKSLLDDLVTENPTF